MKSRPKQTPVFNFSIHPALAPRIRPAGIAALSLFLVLLCRPVTATSPGCGATTYYQDDSEGYGLIALEAETSTYSRASLVEGHDPYALWLEYTSNDAGNGGYVKVPNRGQNSTVAAYQQGAVVSFDIDFVKTGEHTIFVRFRASNTANNSIHLEFDGARIGSWNFPVTGADWTWVAIPVLINPATTGVHNFSVYHLEDGMDLDRFIISSDPNYPIDGIGPDATEDGSNRTRGQNERVEYHMDYRTGQGFAVLEAEQYTYNMTGLLAYECRPWETIDDPSASGGSYMAVAQANELVADADVWAAPLMDYEVSIDVATEYFVHIRHRSPTESDNSIFVAVDYNNPQQFRLSATTNWIWESRSLGTINKTSGTFLLNIVMREDATPIDKIIITTDPNFVPTNTGPLETVMMPARLIYQQDNSIEHLVQLPMEIPTRRLPGINGAADLRWEYFDDPSALGNAYAVVPNQGGVNLQGGNSALAPVQEFDINFINTGTHYLYVRHQAPSGVDNSYTYLFDGVKQNEVHINTLSPGTWRFYEDLPTINVPSTGIHTLGIAMREDGTPIDHVTISASPAYNTSALPVEFLTLDGVAEREINRITWSTAAEENTAYHHVERLAEGETEWMPIGSLAAAGDSRMVESYTFFDRFPPALAYYRIVTQDFDGTQTTSSIVSVTRTPTASRRLEIYPNPAAVVTQLSFEVETDGPITLRVVSLSGQPVAERLVTARAGINQVELPLERMTPGLYTVAAEGAHAPLMVGRLNVVR